MAWTVTASVKAVAEQTRRGDASLAMAEPSDAAGGRVSLIVEMEASFVGTVDITTDMTVQDVRVEVHLANGGANGEDGS